MEVRFGGAYLKKERKIFGSNKGIKLLENAMKIVEKKNKVKDCKIQKLEKR